jgi:hypothetical protein
VTVRRRTDHEMGWMADFTARPGAIDEYIETAGAVLAGRDGWDAIAGATRPCGSRVDRCSS